MCQGWAWLGVPEEGKALVFSGLPPPQPVANKAATEAANAVVAARDTGGIIPEQTALVIARVGRSDKEAKSRGLPDRWAQQPVA